MTKQTEFEHPPKGHTAFLGYDTVNDKWYAVSVDDDGRLQLGTITVGLPSDAATETKQLPDGHNVTIDNVSLAVTGAFYLATQPISAVALPLPSDAATQTTVAGIQAVIGALANPDVGTITKRLENILTELEAKLETSDLNIDGTKDLQVDVKTLPTTIIQAVGGDKPISIESTWAASDYIADCATGTNEVTIATATTNKLWCLTAGYIKYTGTVPTRIALYVDYSGANVRVVAQESPVSAQEYMVITPVWIPAGRDIIARVEGATLHDNLTAEICGYQMDTP